MCLKVISGHSGTEGSGRQEPRRSLTNLLAQLCSSLQRHACCWLVERFHEKSKVAYVNSVMFSFTLSLKFTEPLTCQTLGRGKGTMTQTLPLYKPLDN